MAQRDYILRLIEQVALLLERVVQQRERRAPQEALQSTMAAFERLFGMEAVQIFQFTPDQQMLILAEGEDDATARDKILMYAALTAEAGRCYVELGQSKLAQASFLNALRLTLQARLKYGGEALPNFTPKPSDLLARLGDMPLDPDTAELVAGIGGRSV